jgi:hypothetical protein
VIVRGATNREIKNVSGLEVPPPGEGLLTATMAVPTTAISPAEIEEVSWLLLMKLVERLAPFQSTVEPSVKFEPMTVRVKPLSPALAELGLRLIIAGAGLLIRRLKGLATVSRVG